MVKEFLQRRIAPLQNKGRPAWEFKNVADIMRLRPGLNNNLTVIQHAALCQRLFPLKADKTSKAGKDGKAEKAFKFPVAMVPLFNNSALTSIIVMMLVLNTHGLDQTWAEPDEARVQEFFDNLSERLIRDEPRLIRDTTDEEVAYIASRAEEAALAEANREREKKILKGTKYSDSSSPALSDAGAGAGRQQPPSSLLFLCKPVDVS